MNLEWEIRRRHVKSLIKYLQEERKGLHVTDIVYGCPRYAVNNYLSREAGVVRNIDEAGLIRLSIGRLLDSLSVGDWHHVDLELNAGGILHGQIDDIIYKDGTLVIIDKKTVAEKPPREAHDHYVKQLQYYYAMLLEGKIVGSEIGSVEELEKAVREADSFKLAILYIDVSASTKTMVSDVKIFDPPKLQEVSAELKRIVRDFYATLLISGGDVMKFKPEPSWICHYCSLMNVCWGAGDG
jgi:hypothetical protein